MLLGINFIKILYFESLILIFSNCWILILLDLKAQIFLENWDEIEFEDYRYPPNNLKYLSTRGGRVARFNTTMLTQREQQF